MKRYKTDTGTNTEPFISEKKTEFREFDLPNGLHCILDKDNRNPIINVTAGYKIGSKDEDANKKGIAHLFEHMMFQGSENVKKNDHFEIVMKSGGNNNAFTMHDATVYYDTMPSNALETALWLESDRMRSLNITEENLTNQKNVVIEEKKQNYDNAPYGSMFHNIFRNVFKGSNYEWPVIGEPNDIRSFTVDEAIKFHSDYYSPENSVLIISGDIDYGNSEFLVNKYFGDIYKKNKAIRKKNIIREIENDIELNVHDNIQLRVINICYQIPKLGEYGNYPLEYVAEVMANNKSSRLYQKLVYEKKLIRSVKAFKFALEDRGIIFFKAMINPGTDVNQIRDEIFSEIQELADKGITDEEFIKIKNQIEFQGTVKFLKMQNVSIETIFNYLYFKDADRINSEIKKYLDVSKEDIISSINEFLINKKKLILTYLPKN